MRSIPSPSVNPLDTTKRQVKNSTGQLRDCCLRSSYDFPQSPEHCSPTKYARVSRCSHTDVVMLFCPSFTQSERFLHTDQLIIRLQVVVVTNFIRMLMRNVFVNVFKSDAVILVGSDLPQMMSLCIDLRGNAEKTHSTCKQHTLWLVCFTCLVMAFDWSD